MVGIVLGCIYGGVTGITEAAGMGVIAVPTIGLARRRLGARQIWESLAQIFKGFVPFIFLQSLASSILPIWPSVTTLFP